MNRAPHPAPDGKHFAFVRMLPPHNFEVYVMNLETGEQKRPTYNDGFPAFSPDGKLLAFGSSRDAKPGERKLFTYTMEVSRPSTCSPTSVVRSIRLRLHHEEPFSYVVTVLPEEFGSRIKRDDWTRASILKDLTEKLDVPIGGADQTVRASLADASLARALQVGIGSPLLWVSRVVKRTDGRPVMNLSDIYSFRVHLVWAEQAKGKGEVWWSDW